MKNVMKNAWLIAKQGQVKFGGNVRSYFSASLKMAWSQIKKGAVKMKAIVKTLSGSNNHKSWVAQISIGTAYKFNRNFVNEFEKEGFYGDRIYTLNDGIYDVCNAGDRKYILVANGEFTVIAENEITNYLN